MSRKELTAFRIAPEIMTGLRALKERDGVPISVQVDRALRAWLIGRKALKAETGVTARAFETGAPSRHGGTKVTRQVVRKKGGA